MIPADVAFLKYMDRLPWPERDKLYMDLKEGDDILITETVASRYNSNWGKDNYSTTLYVRHRITRATKTTLVANGVTFTKSNQAERGGDRYGAKGLRFHLIGTKDESSPAEVLAERQNVKARESLYEDGQKLEKCLTKFAFDKRTPLEQIEKVAEHIAAARALIAEHSAKFAK